MLRLCATPRAAGGRLLRQAAASLPAVDGGAGPSAAAERFGRAAASSAASATARRGREAPQAHAAGWRRDRLWSLALPAAFSTTAAARGAEGADGAPRMSDYPPERIRNFCIIAHIDHGKSTLSDRLLEVTGTLARLQKHEAQYLDKLQVEKERGITVKAAAAAMRHGHEGAEYLLNLIDTPGHVDFQYEVSRSIAACQGAVLLVDAVQGVQAQTVANYLLAREAGLRVVPVINKAPAPSRPAPPAPAPLPSLRVAQVDQDHADPARVLQQMTAAFPAIDPAEVILASGKTGFGVDELLAAIVRLVPPPGGEVAGPARALLFDSWFDAYRGVVCLVSLKDGSLRKGDKLATVHGGRTYEALDVGILHPETLSTGELHTGQVGYLVMNMRSSREAQIGDTVVPAGLQKTLEPLPGFKAAKSMVFSGLYPVDQADFEQLREAVERLCLTDASVSVAKESSHSLGQGFRCGFLGLLHMEVFFQRLDQEYDAQVLGTAPTVPYRVLFKNGKVETCQNAAAFPERDVVEEYQEPVVRATVICPAEHLGPALKLLQERRGEQEELTYMEGRVLLKYILPLNEILVDFYDELKALTSGYASFDYEEAGYKKADVVKVTVSVNQAPVDALAFVCHREKAQQLGRAVCQRLKEHLDRQVYEVNVQAAVGSRVLASERLSALRKNVTAKCYGGDISRKKKLLEKQKEGKKKLKALSIGNVTISHEAFLAVLKAR
eukprot:tig00021127_g18821.t1